MAAIQGRSITAGSAVAAATQSEVKCVHLALLSILVKQETLRAASVSAQSRCTFM